jgi:hypothetical protein
MPKNSTVKTTGGPARVRLVVLDAEIPDGDLGAFNQVLQNALRGSTTTIVQQRINGAAAKTLTHQPAAELDGEVEEPVDEAVEEAEISSQPPKQRVPRKPAAMPKVLELDIDSEPSLASFAAKANPTSNHKRYLVIAAWFHLHRKVDAITADHIYTCFRHLSWPSGIADFAQPLRELKHKQYFTTPEIGKYAINQLGLAQVAKLTNGGSDGAP